MNKKITIVRDLKEFYELRDALYKKWKGIYIPPLPTQKMFEEVEAVRFILEGDKDDRYYNEKVVFLQQFFNKVVPLKYIQESVELIAFLTESMPYEKVFSFIRFWLFYQRNPRKMLQKDIRKHSQA
jgi:PX domain